MAVLSPTSMGTREVAFVRQNVTSVAYQHGKFGMRGFIRIIWLQSLEPRLGQSQVYHELLASQSQASQANPKLTPGLSLD